VREPNWLWLSFPGLLVMPLGLSACGGPQACAAYHDLGMVSLFTTYFFGNRW
jgi:hypothetical protein